MGMCGNSRLKSSMNRQRTPRQRTSRSGFTQIPRGSLRNVETDDEDDIVPHGYHHHNHHHDYHHNHQDRAAELAAERAVFAMLEDPVLESEEELARLQQEQERLFAQSRRAVGMADNNAGRNISASDTTHQRPSDESSQRREGEASRTGNTTPLTRRPGTDDKH